MGETYICRRGVNPTQDEEPKNMPYSCFDHAGGEKEKLVHVKRVRPAHPKHLLLCPKNASREVPIDTVPPQMRHESWAELQKGWSSPHFSHLNTISGATDKGKSHGGLKDPLLWSVSFWPLLRKGPPSQS